MELNLKYIPRLPWELRYAIYMFIPIDTRLELLQHKQAKIIRCLYRTPLNHDNINKLIDSFEKGFRIKIFWKDNQNNYNVQKHLLKYLPPATYKKLGQIHEIRNPVFTMLEKECTLQNMYTYEPIWSKKQTIITKLRNCFDIIPTLYGYNSFALQNDTTYKNGQKFQIKQKSFNYQIRKYLFDFICILNIITKDFQQQIDKHDLHTEELSVKRRFKRIILKRIIPMSNKFERRRIKQEKMQAREHAKQEKMQARETCKTREDASKRRCKTIQDSSKRRCKTSQDSSKRRCKTSQYTRKKA